MKILMFGWEFPPHNSGGLGVACLGLTQALAQEGVSVTFVLPKKCKTEDIGIRFLFADSPNLKLKYINSNITPYPTQGCYLKGGKRDIYGHSLIEEVENFRRAAREIAEEEDFDVIHAHDWLSFGAGVEAKKVSGKPLVAHIHATEYDRTGGLSINKIVHRLEKEGFEMADRIIAVSNYTKNLVAEKYNIAKDKISVVHNGTTQKKEEAEPLYDLAALKKKGYKIVLFLGRITLQKGPDYFLRAAKRVLEFNPKVKFIIAGSGDMERQIMDDVSYSGLSDKVIFTGFLRGKEWKSVYSAADLFVMPSVSEPFGIAPLEALSYGTPVLISKQSGVSEVLSHALKVDFWDTEEMANQILSAIKHESLNESLRTNGAEEAGGVTWKKAAQKCSDIYRSLVPSAV